ncbi:MAG: hypothetical protein GQ574_14655 [Crocinitomix sp.]|nr:hypothetical protein [Crocinitomix sp.]
MADFSQTEVAPIQSFTTVKEGVEGPAPYLAEGLTNMFKAVGEIGAANNAKQDEQFVADFVIQQTTLAEAVEQGLPSREALTRMRANFKNAVANAPGLTSELFAAQSSIIGTAGIGQIATTGNEQEARTNRVDNALVDSGAVGPNATDSELAVARTNFQMYEEAQLRFQQQMDTINLSNAAESQKSAQRTSVAQTWLRESSPHKLDTFSGQVKAIVEGVGANGSTGAEALLALDQLWNSVQTEYAGQLVEAGGYGAALVTPFQMLYDTAQKQINGTYSTAFAKAEADRILALQEYMLLLDPEVASVAAASNVIQGLPIDQLVKANNAISRVLAENSLPEGDAARVFTNDELQGQALKGYYDALSSTIRKGDMSDDLHTEMVTHLSNIFAGTVDGGSALSKNAILGKDMVRFFSSQEFYSFLSENPSAKDEGYLEALEILQVHYADEVWGMARREFTDNEIVNMPGGIGATDIFVEDGAATSGGPTPESVSYRATDSGMEFFALDQTNVDAVAKARKLNKTLKPVLNETVRGFAHLNGRTDYGNYWNEVSETILGSQELGDEDLTTNDLVERTTGEAGVTPVSLGADMLRNFEGFREGTYWDVNAHRVGYGSDTITKADGTVVPVKRGDTVTKEDAERDLERRSAEEDKAARLRVGAAAWEALPDAARGALISVAYNYGEIPRRLLASIKTGDVNAIADAVEKLGGDNDGVNRSRRRREAEAIRASANGQTTGMPVTGAPERRPDYASEQAVMEAIEAGDLKEGDIVTVNGVRVRVEAE